MTQTFKMAEMSYMYFVPMALFALLKNDHERLRSLARRVKGDERLREKLRDELRDYLQAADMVAGPALHLPGCKEREARVADLKACVERSADSYAKLDEFIALEERQLFRCIRQEYDAYERSELGEMYAELRDELRSERRPNVGLSKQPGFLQRAGGLLNSGWGWVSSLVS